MVFLHGVSTCEAWVQSSAIFALCKPVKTYNSWVVTIKKPIKFKTTIGVLPHLPGMRYLEVPQRVVQALGGTFKIRLICTVNKKVSFQCGLVALGGGRAYISLSKPRLKKLGLQEGNHVAVQLEADELNDVLKEDADGKRRFDKLTPGKQRYIINFVAAVKSPQLRIERATMLLENLKQTIPGKETFRQILGKFDSTRVSAHTRRLVKTESVQTSDKNNCRS